MNIIIESRAILESAGYRTFSANIAAPQFFFEDDSVLGIVTEHPTVATLLGQWESVQDNFLREHAGQLRTNPTKAWNVYTIHLTGETAVNSLASDLFAVEEDFRGTRKIARAGITDKESLRNALLSLLPVMNQIALAQDDLSQRLADRLKSSHPSLECILENLPASDIAARLMEGV